MIIQKNLPPQPMKCDIKSPEPEDKKQRYEDIPENKSGNRTHCSPVKGNTKSIFQESPRPPIKSIPKSPTKVREPDKVMKSPGGQIVTTRSGRVVRTPSYMKDYAK